MGERKPALGRSLPLMLLLFMGACQQEEVEVDSCAPPAVTRREYPAVPDYDRFAGQLERIRQDYRIPGLSAGMARGGEVVWAQGFGMADRARSRVADAWTVYSLASLTKPVAATLMMQLVEEGRLDLDSPVSAFGIQLGNGGHITVRHLLTHTSEGVPGTAFVYNGARFSLLDAVVARASGMPLARLLQERLVAPLDLKATCPITAPEVAGLDLAQGYCPSGALPQAYVRLFNPAAGLVSNVLEYLAFNLALDAGRLLTPEGLEHLYRPMKTPEGRDLPYALGWFVQEVHGERLVWHYGWWEGTSTLVLKVPRQQLVLVVMANSDMLSRPFFDDPRQGDVTRSDLARFFLRSFAEGFD